MSATIWSEIETGVDRRPADSRRRGYWSGNQGHPTRSITPGRGAAEIVRPVTTR